MSKPFPQQETFFSHPDWENWAGRLSLGGSASPKGIIACSGGADSVYLACLLVFHYGERAGELLRIVHVNHGLRGDDADADAEFVLALANWLGLSYKQVRLAKPGEGEIPDEAQLRDQRFIALEHELREWGGSAIYLGHHKNDIAEGMLISLSRGSSLSGLASPRPEQEIAFSEVEFKDSQYKRCHPLLAFERKEIEQALKQTGMSWREDASNAEMHYLRNRLRQRVMGEWIQSSSQDVLESVAASRAYLEQADYALEWWLDSLGLKTDDSDGLSAGCLRGLPLELWRRAFWRWMNRWHSGYEIRRKALDPFLQQWRDGQSAEWSVGPELSLHCSNGEIRCVHRQALELPLDFCVNWSLDSKLFLPNGRQLSADWVDPAEAQQRIVAKQIDVGGEALIFIGDDKELQVSSWQPGDRMKPLGSPGYRKLQDIFVDKKIPTEKRHQLPVIRRPANNEILWVPGVPPAEAAKVSGESLRVLHIRYH